MIVGADGCSLPMFFRFKCHLVLAALASGTMAAALVPPYDVAALAWVCLLPMMGVLWSLPRRHAGRWGFATGWLAGCVCQMIQINWLATVTTLGAVVLPAYLALFWGGFGAFAATWGNPWRTRDESGTPSGGALESSSMALVLACAWGGLEWLRGWLFTGFAWNGLGVAFHETLVIAQSADLLGVTGLSMLLVYFQCVVLHAGRRVFERRGGGVLARWDFAVAVMLVATSLCYGMLRISQETRRDSTRVRALLVQINIPQDAARVLWEAHEVHMAYEEETLAALARIRAADDQRMGEAMQAGGASRIGLEWPDWVIWPETALTGRILSADDGTWGTWHENLETIRRVREAGDFHLIYGINELEAERTPDGQLGYKEGGRIWNSLAVMDPHDRLQTFRKHHLVIFGEYIPLVESMPWLKRIYEQQSGAAYGGAFTPGDSFDPLMVRGGGRQMGIIPSVCFEDTVARLKRRFARSGPQVIVNVTNDGWFGTSPAAAQHFANARFRAIELRRPMLRCANTGVTAAVDTIGSTAHPDDGSEQRLVDGTGSHFTRGSLLAAIDVPNDAGFSLYARLGDWPVICLGLWSLWAGYRRRGR